MLGMAGCHAKTNPDSSPAAFQIINCVPDSGNLKASVAGRTLIAKVAPGTTSGLYGTSPGHFDIALTELPDDAQPIALDKARIDVEAGRHYTVLAYGVALAPNQVSVFSVPKLSASDRKAVEQSGKSTVRVFNAAPGEGKLDVLVNSIVAFKNVGYGELSDAIPLAALPYEWSVKPAGDSVDMFGNPITVQLKSGRNYVVIIMGSVSTNNIDIQAFEE